MRYLSSRMGDSVESAVADSPQRPSRDKDESRELTPVLELAALLQSASERQTTVAATKALAYAADMASVRCKRCACTMALVTTVAAIGKQPGLNAYMCPSCGRADSRLLPRR